MVLCVVPVIKSGDGPGVQLRLAVPVRGRDCDSVADLLVVGLFVCVRLAIGVRATQADKEVGSVLYTQLSLLRATDIVVLSVRTSNTQLANVTLPLREAEVPRK
jgi:hypothetical protein